MCNKNIDELFQKYLEICNKAIAENKDRFPYKNLMSLSENILGDHKIDLAVYDDNPKGAYSLQFRDKKLELAEKPPEKPESAWRVNRSYLEKVVSNPEKYVEHPERLDLDWLKSRIGL